ncbi:MAG: hypothetical protein NXH88_13675 [Hyphomonas sp.]|nr:hypothetical protein [Hyphomonas sp.]
MLIKRKVLDRIAAGDVDLAFRWWKRPTVKAGGRLRTAVGELAITDVDAIDPASLTQDDSRRAGYQTLEALKADLAARPDSALYRIAMRYHGQDSRIELREDAELSDDQCSEVLARLNRLDQKAGSKALSPRILDLIGNWPERRAQELANEVRMEKQDFKRHVRKLKELGLTESLPVGYRLSPRGQRLLEFARNQDRL